MVPDDVPYSNRRIDRAGKLLRASLVGEVPALSGYELEEAAAVIEGFRAAHNVPLLAARMGLRSCIDTEGVPAVEITQRLKRTPTIVDKLRRLPTMTLSRMQDEDITFDTAIDYKNGAGSEIVHEWLRRLAGAPDLIVAGMTAGEALGPDYDELSEAAAARIVGETRQEGGRHV